MHRHHTIHQVLAHLTSGARLWLVVLIVGVLTSSLPLATSPAHADDPHFNPPKRWYLALGDSLSANPATVPTGFVSDFGALLARIRPAIQTRDLACPGETTTSFRVGGECPASAPQLAQALQFLRETRGQAGPLTLTLGSNDLLEGFEQCLPAPDPAQCDAATLPGVIATAQDNLMAILTALRRASPSTELILVNIYDPLAPLAPETVPAVHDFNAMLATVAAAAGVRVADAFTPFNAAPPQPQTICALTGMCPGGVPSPPPPFGSGDIHPSPAGNAVLAAAAWQASGYDRLR